jgi:hypothetical protein
VDALHRGGAAAGALTGPGASPPPAAYASRLARTVGAPVLFGAVTVSLGTLGYVLFCPGITWTLAGQADRPASFLIAAALVGGLAGAALGLCIAADRAARDISETPATGTGVARRPRRSAAGRRLRRPPVRYGRESRLRHAVAKVPIPAGKIEMS